MERTTSRHGSLLGKTAGSEAELQRSARLDVLFAGYATAPRVAGTVSVIRDADRVIVVDPGMVPSRSAILDPLRRLGLAPRTSLTSC